MNRDDRAQAWWARGACVDMPPARVDRVFFPQLGHPGTRPKYLDQEAVRICASCPVQRECLQFAVDNEILVGTYGGVPDYVRRKVFHKGRRASRGKTA